MDKMGSMFYRNGTSYWSYKIGNKCVSLLKGANDETTKAAAQLLYDAALLKHNQLSAADLSTKTVKDIFELYKLAHAHLLFKKSHRDKVKVMDSFIQSFPDLLFSDIHRSHINSFLDSLDTRNSTSKATTLARLSSVFNSPMVFDIRNFNPCKKATKYKEEVRGEEIAITPEVFEILRRNMKGVYKDILEVMWFTGARPSEILESTVDEWYSSHGAFLKNNHKTMHLGYQRKILVPAPAQAIIQRNIGVRKTGYIFQSKGKSHVMLSNFAERMKAIGKKCKIEMDLMPYGLRHGFAVYHLKRRISIEIVSSWLGHKSIAVTQRHYAKLWSLLSSTGDLLSQQYLEPATPPAAS